MNIFYLDECPWVCATLMHNRHVVKMPLETAQLLSTAHVEVDGRQVAYKSTHKAHPSAIWTMEAKENYLWLYEHFKALITEHQHRYPMSNLHKSARFLEALAEPPQGITRVKRTPIRLAMPEILKAQYSGVEAYRKYYRIYKRVDKDGRKATWTERPVPQWFVIQNKHREARAWN